MAAPRTVTALIGIPLILALATPIVVYVFWWSAGMTRSPADALVLTMFVVGPGLMLAGHWIDSWGTMVAGFAVYTATILLWGLSWGGLHLLVGFVPALAALVLHALPGRRRRAAWARSG